MNKKAIKFWRAAVIAISKYLTDLLNFLLFFSSDGTTSITSQEPIARAERLRLELVHPTPETESPNDHQMVLIPAGTTDTPPIAEKEQFRVAEINLVYPAPESELNDHQHMVFPVNDEESFSDGEGEESQSATEKVQLHLAKRELSFSDDEEESFSDSEGEEPQPPTEKDQLCLTEEELVYLTDDEESLSDGEEPQPPAEKDQLPAIQKKQNSTADVEKPVEQTEEEQDGICKSDICYDMQFDHVKCRYKEDRGQTWLEKKGFKLFRYNQEGEENDDMTANAPDMTAQGAGGGPYVSIGPFPVSDDEENSSHNAEHQEEEQGQVRVSPQPPVASQPVTPQDTSSSSRQEEELLASPPSGNNQKQ